MVNDVGCWPGTSPDPGYCLNVPIDGPYKPDPYRDGSAREVIAS